MVLYLERVLWAREIDLIVRQGPAGILTGEEDVEIVGEGGDGMQAVEVAPEMRPDVIVMDSNSLVYAVVLKPLPFAESDRVMSIYNSYPKAGVIRASNGVPDYFDRLRDVSVFEEQALYNTPRVTIGDKGAVDQVPAMNVTPSFFRLLRVNPLLGRIFTEDEGEPGNERKVILSYALWQQRYGGQNSAIGQDLRIYGNPYTIVGVMPRDFVFLDPEVRLWRPLAFTAEQKSISGRHNNSYQMMGRLKPGTAREQAQTRPV